MGVEEWVKKQGWKECATAKGERYYCRFSHPRVGWFVSGRVVIGWRDAGTANSVLELVKILANAKGEEISV